MTARPVDDLINELLRVLYTTIHPYACFFPFCSSRFNNGKSCWTTMHIPKIHRLDKSARSSRFTKLTESTGSTNHGAPDIPTMSESSEDHESQWISCMFKAQRQALSGAISPTYCSMCEPDTATVQKENTTDEPQSTNILSSSPRYAGTGSTTCPRRSAPTSWSIKRRSRPCTGRRLRRTMQRAAAR